MNDFSETQTEYQVSIWEGMAIAAGAVLIVAAGLAGLGVKALGNAFDAERAEAIARSLMSYEIPGGSRGFFGANIGGGKMAVVASTATVTQPGVPQSPPAVELFLAQVPLTEETKTEDGADATPQPENELFSGFSFSYQDPATFQITNQRVEQKLFCGATTPVEIQQGNLTVVDGFPPVPAIKYEVRRPLETENQVVVISALGNNAPQQIDQVFGSLACKS